MIKKAMVSLVALGAIVLPATLAVGQVTSVQANLFTGANDTNFDGSTLTVSEASVLDLVTVNEASALSGYINMSLDLTTNFDSVVLNTSVWGKFIGGSVSLKFDDGVNFYELGGPIDVLLVKIDFATGGGTPIAQLSAEGLFQAVTANLPMNPSGNWPVLTSSLKGLIFQVGQDLTSYQWDNAGGPDPWTGDAESQWQFIPDDSAVPEPTTLALLVLGGIAALRRRQ